MLVGVVVVVGAVVTGIVGSASVAAVSTPLYTLRVEHLDRTYVVRVGDVAFRDRTALYRGSGITKKLVDDVALPLPDRLRFVPEHHVKTMTEGAVVLVYPAQGGREARVVLPR